MEVDKKLRQETARYWHEITPMAQYDFDRHTRDADVVKTLTLPQLRTFWDKNCARDCPKRRKASFQVGRLFIYIYFFLSLISYNSHHNSRAQSRETVPAPNMCIHIAAAAHLLGRELRT